MSRSLLTLNECVLLFVPADDYRTNFVTSVPHHRNEEISACYNTVQETVSDLVIKLATQNARKPFPGHAFPIVLEGEGYNLHIALKEWDYGQTIELAWGGKTLVPTERKWRVLFEMA